MDYIKSGFENFKHIIDLSRFDFAGFNKGVIQSSTATMAIIIAALLAGQISLENSSNFRY